MSERNSKEQVVQTVDEVPSQEVSQIVEPAAGIRVASDEDVQRASAKVFRLHARLFEELAK